MFPRHFSFTELRGQRRNCTRRDGQAEWACNLTLCLCGALRPPCFVSVEAMTLDLTQFNQLGPMYLQTKTQ